ncbi:non-heme iron oxygenase ferredoxin subunit [Chelatococcus sp. GCM10030263]|uniref:non-heme iron oxygenase ferredoxin subunit n=1 Tax=Chelatococcus sp. GCM10030263 TaxID=3273387 RepID=UPI003606E1A0
MTEDTTWIRVAALSEIGAGEVRSVEVNGRSLALYRLEDGSVHATDNECTHALAYLSEGWLEGDVIECPLHGGCFNVRTGKGLGDPIEEDLRTYPVQIAGDDILIAWTEK